MRDDHRGAGGNMTTTLATPGCKCPTCEYLRATSPLPPVQPNPWLPSVKHEDKCILEAALRLAGFANRKAVPT